MPSFYLFFNFLIAKFIGRKEMFTTAYILEMVRAKLHSYPLYAYALQVNKFWYLILSICRPHVISVIQIYNRKRYMKCLPWLSLKIMTCLYY